MARTGAQNILLVGDKRREMEDALAQALPGTHVTAVGDYFEAIAELASGRFTAVIASAEPIERRPEAAVRTLRQLAPNGRLVLFGHPALEPMARRMLEFGCDDYVVAPPGAPELQRIFASQPLRLVPEPEPQPAPEEPAPQELAQPSAAGLPSLAAVPLAELVLDALTQEPGDAAAAAAKRIGAHLGSDVQLLYQPNGAEGPQPVGGISPLSQAVRAGDDDVGQLHLYCPAHDPQAARHLLAQLAQIVSGVATLQDRHVRLQKLAITDQLTGVYNRRYFEHFLAQIIERARTMRFAVTLLSFDIDNFKSYNDEFGHGLGDEILRETAALMKRCCREHDLVARIGGDEFAVVFWEKDGPRQPKNPAQQPAPRAQQTPRMVFDRFRRILATRELPALGTSGQGVLTISGGFASYPWDGRDVPELVAAADRDLMFGAKRPRRNSIVLVGDHSQPPQEDDQAEPRPGD